MFHENLLPVFVQVVEVHQVLAPHMGDKHEIQCVTDDKVRPSKSLRFSVLELCLMIFFIAETISWKKEN